MLTGGNREKDICSINLRVVLNYYFGLNVSHHDHPQLLLTRLGQPHDCETVVISHFPSASDTSDTWFHHDGLSI